MDKEAKKMKIWKYSGIFLIATGILHTIFFFFFGKDAFVEIFRDGLLFDMMSRDITHEFALWFLICGVFIILLGHVIHLYIKREQKPAPLLFGYSLLVFTIFGCIVEPGSGFWLFLPQAVIIIIANRKVKTPTDNN
jgi:hypothetical protein